MYLLSSGITGYSSVMGCFMFTNKIVSDGFHKHAFAISSHASHNLFSPLIMKQKGQHSLRCITLLLYHGALQ